MGYITKFDIEMSDHSLNYSQEFKDLFEEKTGYYFECDSCIEAKWYDFEKNMVEISKHYKDVLFTVEGRGEDDNDIWRHYFKNGKSWRTEGKVTFEPFDEDYLN